MNNSPIEIHWDENGGWAVDENGDVKPIDDYPGYGPDIDYDGSPKTFEVDAVERDKANRAIGNLAIEATNAVSDDDNGHDADDDSDRPESESK